MGPFYATALEGKKIVYVHELENKQVYSYARNTYPLRPGDGEREQKELQQLEAQVLYRPAQEQLPSQLKKQ